MAVPGSQQRGPAGVFLSPCEHVSALHPVSSHVRQRTSCRQRLAEGKRPLIAALWNRLFRVDGIRMSGRGMHTVGSLDPLFLLVPCELLAAERFALVIAMSAQRRRFPPQRFLRQLLSITSFPRPVILSGLWHWSQLFGGPGTWGLGKGRCVLGQGHDLPERSSPAQGRPSGG